MNIRSNVKRYTKEKYPLMKEKLHKEFLELRKKGTGVKRSWFTLPGRQILNDLYREKEFKFSDHWFGQFSKRKGVSLRKKTHKNQKDPADLRFLIQQFHAKLLQENKKNGKTTNYVTLLTLTKPFCLLLWIIAKPMIALMQKRFGVLHGALV